MTILEAINSVDSLKHNTYSDTDKRNWLSRLDWMVKTEIIGTHAGGNIYFAGYNDDTPDDTVLLIPPPYDEVYLRWMEAQIDYHNGEYNKYNNSIIMFNTAYEGFAAYYKRTHAPLGGGQRFIF